MLGLKITYLVISYFMGKKSLTSVCVTRDEGNEAKMQ